MKKWMIFVAGIQMISVLIWLAQAVKIWPASLAAAGWVASWLMAFPGSVLGPWAAEQMLWTRVSLWTICAVGLVLATLINLLIAFVVGTLCKRVYAMSKNRH